jgi:hypothetical protein
MAKCLSVFMLIIMLGSIMACNGDGGLTNVLNDPTCRAPCWRGITMGTSKEEVVNSLTKMSDVEPESISTSRTNRPYEEEVINWKFKGISEFGNIILNGNKVSEMVFPLNKQLSLASIISIYGPPESLIIKKLSGDGIYLQVYILYQKKGICLEHQPSLLPFVDPNTYLIVPSTKIVAVYYTNPSVPDLQLNLGCEPGTIINVYESIVQDWKGYGSYKVYEQKATH